MGNKLKKIFILGVIALAAILSLASLFRTETPTEIVKSEEPTLAAQVSSFSYSFILDEDEDGLTNAEEFLYGTDPENPDTDADGYVDGIELDNNFDPLNPGSDEDDRLSNRPIKSLTLKYLIWARETTGQNRPKISSVLVDQFLNESNAFDFSLPTVPNGNLKMVDSSAKAVAEYLQQTAAISLPGGDTSYDAVAQQVIKNGVSPQLEELADAFAQTLAEFKRVPTPPEALELQRLYVSTTQELADMFEDLEDARSDPVQITLNQSRGVWLVDQITDLNLKRDALAKSIEGR